MTGDRPLSDRQRIALSLCARDFVSSHTTRSMPSLARRGLVEPVTRRTASGRPYKTWQVTPAGRAVVAAGPTEGTDF